MRNQVPRVVEEVWSLLNHEAPTYLVGGALRDLLRGAPPHDWDLATRLPPDLVQAIGEQRGYRVVSTGKAYGTVTWLTELGPLEVTTFRQDGRYRDGRHPEWVRFADTIEEDLSRRDFTMNAMAMAFDGTVEDPFHGAGDLAQGRIRTVGNPEVRFDEDPLRMLRAIRFVGLDAQGRAFTLDPTVWAKIQQLKTRILNVSAERQRDELRKLLASPHFSQALIALDKTGLLGAIWPEWMAAKDFWPQNSSAKKPLHQHLLDTAAQGPSPLLRLVGLLHDIAQPDCSFAAHDGVGSQYARRMLERLAWDRDTIDRVALLISLHRFSWHEADDRAIRRLLREHGDEVVEQLLEFRLMDARGDDKEWDQESQVRRRVLHLQTDPPMAMRTLQVSGTDVMQWTRLKPGPAIGSWLTRLQDWVDEDPSRNSLKVLKAWVLQEMAKDLDGGKNDNG